MVPVSDVVSYWIWDTGYYKLLFILFDLLDLGSLGVFFFRPWIFCVLGCGTWILPIGSFVWTLDLGF